MHKLSPQMTFTQDWRAGGILSENCQKPQLAEAEAHSVQGTDSLTC